MFGLGSRLVRGTKVVGLPLLQKRNEGGLGALIIIYCAYRVSKRVADYKAPLIHPYDDPTPAQRSDYIEYIRDLVYPPKNAINNRALLKWNKVQYKEFMYRRRGYTNFFLGWKQRSVKCMRDEYNTLILPIPDDDIRKELLISEEEMRDILMFKPRK